MKKGWDRKRGGTRRRGPGGEGEQEGGVKEAIRIKKAGSRRPLGSRRQGPGGH